MILKHKEKGYKLQVASRHGKPIITKDGLVVIQKGTYKGFEKVALDLLLEKFEVL